jgi:hypothetical protein
MHTGMSVTKQIRIIMMTRGLDYAAVAKLTGFAKGTVRNNICGYQADPGVRTALEAALGHTFWSEPAAVPQLHHSSRSPTRKRKCH